MSNSQEKGQIFVRGFSRSGGTLMVTLFDAHPDVAMSYELYESILFDDEDNPLLLKDLILYIKGKRPKKYFFFDNENAADQLKKIKGRLDRGGLTQSEIIGILKNHKSKFHNLDTDESRLTLMSLFCKEKMKKEGKSFWGMKCNNNYPLYSKLWPNAKYVNMVRDGRDVLASQMTKGSFNRDPTAIAKGWVSTHTKFKEAVKAGVIDGLEIIYEDLIRNPETVIPRICEFAEIPFSEKMLQHNRQDLTIYKSNHMSMDAITKPLDESKIGQWKKKVSQSEVDLFLQEAGKMMEMYSYL